MSRSQAFGARNHSDSLHSAPVLRSGEGRLVAILAFLLPALLFSAAGCREAGLRMDVRPEVRLRSGSLPASGPVELTYVWQAAENMAAVTRDYRVFVHFWGEDGQLHWQDDHNPPTPTSRWQAGESVEYTRIRFIPANAPLEEITMTVGLYDHGGTEEKVKLDGRRGRKLEYEVGRFEVIPADQLPEIIYQEGWYLPEFVPGKPDGEVWRWCQAHAVCLLESPGRASALFLEAQSPVELLSGTQKVTIELEGMELTTFEVTDTERFIRKIPLPLELMQGKEYVGLGICVDQAVIPRERELSDDDRQLGLKFFRLAVS